MTTQASGDFFIEMLILQIPLVQFFNENSDDVKEYPMYACSPQLGALSW